MGGINGMACLEVAEWSWLRTVETRGWLGWCNFMTLAGAKTTDSGSSIFPNASNRETEEEIAASLKLFQQLFSSAAVGSSAIDSSRYSTILLVLTGPLPRLPGTSRAIRR